MVWRLYHRGGVGGGWSRAVVLVVVRRGVAVIVVPSWCGGGIAVVVVPSCCGGGVARGGGGRTALVVKAVPPWLRSRHSVEVVSPWWWWSRWSRAAVVMMRYCCGGGSPSCCGSGVVAVMSPRLWSCGGEGVAVVCEGDLERDGDSGCHRWSVWRLTFLASLRRGGDHGSWGW